MALFWQCNGDGIAIRSYRDTSNNNNVLGRNERGTIIKTFDEADDLGWLYQQEKYVNGSWVTSKGYTWASYYTKTSDPTPSGGGSGGGGSTDTGSGGQGTDYSQWTYVDLGSGSNSISISYNLGENSMGRYYFTPIEDGILTVENTASDYSTYFGIGTFGNVEWNDRTTDFADTVLVGPYESNSSFNLGYANPFTFETALNGGDKYEVFMAAFAGASMRGTFIITFTPKQPDYYITYFIPASETYWTSWASSSHDPSEGGAVLTTSKPQKSGYIFKGWSKTKDAKLPTYYSGSNTDITSNTELYAVFWPEFTWKDYTYSEFLTLYNSTMTQYNQSLLAAPTRYAYYEANLVNKLRTALGISELTGLKGTRISKAPLDECSTRYNKVNGL